METANVIFTGISVILAAISTWAAVVMLRLERERDRRSSVDQQIRTTSLADLPSVDQSSARPPALTQWDPAVSRHRWHGYIVPIVAALGVGPAAAVSLLDTNANVLGDWDGHIYTALYAWLAVLTIASIVAIDKVRGSESHERKYMVASWLAVTVLLAAALAMPIIAQNVF